MRFKFLCSLDLLTQISFFVSDRRDFPIPPRSRGDKVPITGTSGGSKAGGESN